MRVLILGVGDAFTKTSFGSSAVVDAPDGPVLIDCPDPIHRAIHEASCASGWALSADDIHDLIITHLHGDHCNGLESFGFARKFLRKGDADAPTPRLHTHPKAAHRVWERLAPAMDGAVNPDSRNATLEDYYDLRTFNPGEPFTVAGLTVEARFGEHPLPCVGLKLSDGERTLAWSGDTSYVQAHVDWLADADLVVHETNRGPAHTPLEQLNALPEDLRRRMRLIHIPDDFDPSRTDIPALRAGDLLEF